MRVFTAVRHANDPSKFYGSLWSSNFYPALNELGCELVESQTDLYATSLFMSEPSGFTKDQLEIRAQTTQRIIDEVKTAHAARKIDVFLSYFYNSHFDPSGFDEIHRLGIPTINYYCNSIYQFGQVAAIAAKANFSWHAEKHARQSYLNVGARPVWVQMAADPKVYRPVPSCKMEQSAVFVGQRYADRDRWMASLIQRGIPVVIYGPGWGEKTPPNGPAASLPVPARPDYRAEVIRIFKRDGIFGAWGRLYRQYQYRNQSRALSSVYSPHARGAVPFTQICTIFSSHEVVLNFSNVWSDGRPGSKLIPHVRLRDFEAPMCRTCYLTGYTDEIEEFYEIGKEIATYNSPEELVEKSRYFLANPSEAEKLREAGYRRALRDHTWTQRFKQLFKEVGLAR